MFTAQACLCNHHQIFTYPDADIASPIVNPRTLSNNKNGSIIKVTDGHEKSNLITYDCQSVKTWGSRNVRIFPNTSFFQAFSDVNSVLSQLTHHGKPIEYSMSDGILLHMYRDCGISEAENDIDFIVPLKHVLKVRDAFKESDHFGVYKSAGGLRRHEV